MTYQTQPTDFTYALHETQNGLSENIRVSAVEILQARLSDAVDLTTQTKQAHWTVRGPNFIALHKLFDELHEEMDELSDLIAERLQALGGQAQGTSRMAAAATSLPEYPSAVTGGAEHVKALSAVYAAFGDLVRADIDATAELGDAVTSDVLTEVARAVDKALWFIEAHAG